MGVLAQSGMVIAPGRLATQDVAFVSGTLAFPNLHLQEVYGAQHFPKTGMIITELRFRPDFLYGRAFTTTVEQIQFNLSTTTRPPDFLNSIFTNNPGVDDTVVFSGP